MSFIRRITEVAFKDGSNPSITPLYREKRKKRVSRFLKPVDKAQRKVFQAFQVFGNEINARSARSATKKDNGALVESGANLAKAGKKAMRRIRK